MCFFFLRVGDASMLNDVEGASDFEEEGDSLSDLSDEQTVIETYSDDIPKFLKGSPVEDGQLNAEFTASLITKGISSFSINGSNLHNKDKESSSSSTRFPKSSLSPKSSTMGLNRKKRKPELATSSPHNTINVKSENKSVLENTLNGTRVFMLLTANLSKFYDLLPPPPFKTKN